ncbi:hypothetical protein [Bergeyella zoohelcum]|uniref:hypothetical protein n=1 Tax=Bergeyella zoohelcum TaxID=1015 RepID=UPI002A91081A|nr:hypothetical protein [Bergeyella zoohelcum]MDY6025641.1 hypothetical protein [Bergeyella zoohelcum]
MKKIKFFNSVSYILLSLLFIACNRDRGNIEKQLASNIQVEYDKKSNTLKFGTKEDIRKFVDKYDEYSDLLNNYYEEGFIPYRVDGNVSELILNELLTKQRVARQKSNILKKQQIFNRMEENGDEIELIDNDRFAAILNAEGAVGVEGKVYYYTEKGLFFSDEEDEEYLRNYIANNSVKAQEGVNVIDDKIHSYAPIKKEREYFQLMPLDDGYAGGGGGSYSLNIPTNTNHYNNCSPKEAWIDNIFGRHYVCEYYFNSKRKLRTSFGVEDYYLWFDVYAQSKFKHKTWFGWFSSRDARKVYVKINKSVLTMKDRTVKLKFNAGDIQQVVNQIHNILNTTTNKRVAYLSNVYTSNNNSTDLENYTLDQSEMIAGGNSNSIVTPNKKSLISNVSIDFKQLFGKTPKKVFVVTVLGNEQYVTDQQLLDIAYRAYKKYVVDPHTNSPKPSVGVVLMQKAMNNQPAEEAKIVSYAFGNEVVEVSNLAVASRTFDIPKRFTFNSAQVNFDLNNWKNISLNIEVGWKVPDKYDVSIEGGAYYDGQWGGSKFVVTRK